MLEYIEQQQNRRDTEFVGPPKQSMESYGNRLRVEETFFRYRRIIANKFEAQNFLGQQYVAKLSLLILNRMMAIGILNTIRIA